MFSGSTRSATREGCTLSMTTMGVGCGAVKAMSKPIFISMAAPALPDRQACATTSMSTFMPIESVRSPVNVPHSGTACRGSRATATRMRS